MPVRVRLAATTADLDELFRLRHRVLVEDRGYFPPQRDGRLADRFDAYPTTANLIALSDGRVVGGVRYVEAGPVGMPSDAYFDFTPFLPPDSRIACGGMLCLEAGFRHWPRLISTMVGMGFHWALQRELTHLVGAFAPAVVGSALGAHAVAPEFVEPHSGLPVIPAVFDLAELDARFREFARRQLIVHVLQSSQRQFHRAGETVIRMGDEATEAFVVVAGEASVVAGPADARTELARLGRGEVFGELALLTAQRRSADVVAATDLDLMVLDQRSFQDRLWSDREVATELLRTLGTRLAALNERLVRMTANSRTASGREDAEELDSGCDTLVPGRMR